MPPCWWRRPAPARPRACRWCCSTSRGRRTRRSWCWSRAGWPRAPPPRAWRRRWASRSATPSACACASAPRSRKRTRIEVVTEGVFTRLMLDDPSLDGVAAVLFDEFHERSLDADLGLALARDAQQGLREDLKILVMSATLDGARVAALLGDAPVVESEGRAFPVETRYLGRDPRARIEEPGGRRRAARVARRARARCWCSCRAPAKSAAPRRCSRSASTDPASTSSRSTARSTRASRTAPSRRRRPGGARWCWRPRSRKPRSPSRACAWSSTAGLSRVPRYEPDVGLTRLETVRVSRAAADQRRGRAGRTEPGVCYRLWDEPQTGSLEPYTRPEILSADLSSFVLDLAQWGASDPAKLAFLDPPPQAGAQRSARRLLGELGAIDAQGRITEEGRKLARAAAAAAARPHGGRCGGGRRRRAGGGRSPPCSPNAGSAATIPICATGSINSAATARAAPRMRARWRSRWSLIGRWKRRRPNPARRASPRAGEKFARLSARARLSRPHRQEPRRRQRRVPARQWPRRHVDPASALAREPFLAVAELDRRRGGEPHYPGGADRARRNRGALCRTKSRTREAVTFDAASASLRARRSRRLGALVLAEQTKAVEPTAENAKLLAEGIAGLGIGKLPWSKAQLQLRDRVQFLRKRAKARNGPICPMTRWRAAAPNGWRRS